MLPEWRHMLLEWRHRLQLLVMELVTILAAWPVSLLRIQVLVFWKFRTILICTFGSGTSYVHRLSTILFQRRWYSFTLTLNFWNTNRMNFSSWRQLPATWVLSSPANNQATLLKLNNNHSNRNKVTHWLSLTCHENYSVVSTPLQTLTKLLLFEAQTIHPESNHPSLQQTKHPESNHPSLQQVV